MKLPRWCECIQRREEDHRQPHGTLDYYSIGGEEQRPPQENEWEQTVQGKEKPNELSV